MVLSREDIEWLVHAKRLINPFLLENVGPCSYDLTVGEEYYCYDKSDGDHFVTRSLADGFTDRCNIPPNSCAFILTKESINMPLNITGQLSLRFALTKRGIMLSPQAPIEPGYSGKVMMMLYNLSDETQVFKRGDPFVTVSFHEVSSTTEAYAGVNQGVTTIEGFMQSQRPVRSSMSRTEASLERESQELHNQLSAYSVTSGRRTTTALTVIAIVLAIATLIAALLTMLITVRGSLTPGRSSHSTTSPTASTIPTPSAPETNKEGPP